MCLPHGLLLWTVIMPHKPFGPLPPPWLPGVVPGGGGAGQGRGTALPGAKDVLSFPAAACPRGIPTVSPRVGW